MYPTLTSITGPAVEPVTLALARKHCRIDNEDDDDLLGMYMQAARVQAENYLNRSLITQTWRLSLTNSAPSGSWPLTLSAPIILPMWASWPLLFQRPIQLPRSPVQSVSAVTTTNADGSSNTLVLGTGYSVDTQSTPARLLLTGGAQPTAGQDVGITYVAGYGDIPESVPQSLRTAILFATAWFYEHRGDEQLDMPEGCYTLMTPYRLVDCG